LKLKNKWALITGGSRGIGRGICLELAKEGCSVVANYVSDYSKAKKQLVRLKIYEQMLMK